MKKNSEFYELGGIKFDRVTSVLGFVRLESEIEFLLKKGKREANRIRKSAMSIGSNVDEAIRESVLGNDRKALALKKQEERNCYEAFKQWKKDYAISEISSATTLYDPTHRVAGTPDLWLPSETTDVKCATRIREKYWLQVNWYAITKNHTHCSILRLDPSLAIYEYKRIPVSEYLYEVFYAALKLYRHFNKSVLEDGEKESEVTNDGDNTSDE